MKTKLNLGVLSAAVVVVLGLGAGGAYWANHDNKPAKSATTASHQTTQKKKPTTQVTYDGAEGQNALDLLKKHATVVTKDSSYGPYVDSINGVKGGEGGKYWTFYINGTQATVGAGTYTTKAGDKIEWKFQ